MGYSRVLSINTGACKSRQTHPSDDEKNRIKNTNWVRPRHNTNGVGIKFHRENVSAAMPKIYRYGETNTYKGKETKREFHNEVNISKADRALPASKIYCNIISLYLDTFPHAHKETEKEMGMDH